MIEATADRDDLSWISFEREAEASPATSPQEMLAVADRLVDE